MSRLSKRLKTIKEAQNKIRTVLQELDVAHKLLCEDAGFCGTTLCCNITRNIDYLEKLIETDPQQLINNNF